MIHRSLRSFLPFVTMVAASGALGAGLTLALATAVGCAASPVDESSVEGGAQGLGLSTPITILSYNLWMKPGCGFRSDCNSPAKNERAQAIVDRIGPMGIDILAFQEGFDSEAVGEGSCNGQSCRDSIGILKNGLWNSGYRWITANVDESDLDSDGGVFVASRWPIDRTANMVFQNHSGEDSWANKGAVYAKIRQNGRLIHVFATHLNSDGAFSGARRAQLYELSHFIRSQSIPAGEPIFVAGDLNEDYWGPYKDEMLSILGATAPAPASDWGGRYTYDPTTNRWFPPRSAEPRAWYDYVLFIDNGAGISGTQRSFRPQATITNLPNRDLSDHFAVRGSFTVRGYQDPVTVSLRLSPFLNPTCVDVPGGQGSPGLAMQMYPCHGGPVQQWLLHKIAGTQNFEIRSQFTDRCLQNTSGLVVQQPCSRSAAQQWQIRRDSQDSTSPRYRWASFRNAETGYCMNVDGANRLVATRDCATQPSAGILFAVAVEQTTNSFQLRSAQNGWCVDVPFGTTNDSLVQSYPCNGGNNQMWSARPLGENYFEIRRANSPGMNTSLCLTQTGMGSGVWQRPCSGATTQRFALSWRPDGSMQLSPRNTRSCVATSPTSSSRNLVGASCEGNPSTTSGQLWRIE